MIENRQTQNQYQSWAATKSLLKITANLTESQRDKAYEELQDIIMLDRSQYRGICQSVVAGMFGSKSEDKSEKPGHI